MASVKNDSLESKLLSLSEKAKMNLNTDFIKTGYVMLDMIMGGGLPMGKVIEIFSESGYGKSTTVLSICLSLCRQGHKVLYIDAEGAINELVKSMGFYGMYDSKTKTITTTDEFPNYVWSPDNPTGNFVVIQTSYFEDIEKYFETLLPKYDEKGNPIPSDFRLVVIDSVAMLAPQEYKGEGGEKGISIASNQPGVVAKLLTAFLKKFNGYKTMFNVSFFFINQLREDLSMSFYKDTKKTAGCKALTYTEDIRLQLVNLPGGIEDIQETNTVSGKQKLVLGKEVGIRAVKNRLTNSGITLPLYIRFGYGISIISALPYILPYKRIVNKAGEETPVLTSSGGSWQTLTYNIYKTNEDGSIPKDKKGNPILEVIETKSVRLNGRKELINFLKGNMKYIGYIIRDEDFNLLTEGIPEGYEAGVYYG